MIRRGLLTATLVIIAGGVLYPQAPPSPEPGVYSTSIQVTPPAGVVPETIRYRFAGSQDPEWVTYAGPVEITAVPGAERQYVLYALHPETGEELGPFGYTIDRRAPEPPHITPPPRTYRRAVDVTFDGSDTILLLKPGASGFQTWDGTPLSLDPGPGRREEYVISAYARDGAGNAGRTTIYRYVVDRTAEQEVDLRVFSPAAGAYANEQYLIARARGVHSIEYSTGGPFTAYTGPVALPGGSEQTVTIRARMNDRVVAERSVTYSAGLQQLGGFDFSVVFTPRTLTPEASSDLQYRVSAIQDETWLPLPAHLSLEPVEGLVRPVEILLRRRSDDTDGPVPVFRYVYLLDGSVPDPPAIHVERSIDKAQVVISSSDDQDIYYTIDGTEPSRSSTPYEGPVTIDIPDDSVGSVLIAARAYGRNGRASRIVRERLPYDTVIPAAPVARTTTLGGSRLLVQASTAPEARPDTRLVFETSYGSADAPVPTPESPQLSEDVVLTVPYGMTQSVSLRLAAVSGSGRLSTDTPLVVALLDRQPPASPAILVQDQQFLLRGEGDLFYRVLRDGVPTTAEFLPYLEPVDVPGEGGRTIAYSLESYAADAAGNKSAIAASRSISVRAPIPTMPEITGIPTGGRTAQPVQLDHTSTEPGVEIRYTMTTDGTTPPEPGPQSPLLQRVTVSGAEDEEHLIRVRARPFVAATGTAGRSEEVSFIIDRRPPRLPEPAIVRWIDSGTMAVVTLDPRPGESLLYRTGEDGDFIAYRDPLVLRPEAGENVLSYYTADSVGNRSELVRTTLSPPQPPSPPEIVGVDDQGVYRENLTISAATGTSGRVVYELGTQTQPPSDPTRGSPELEELVIRAAAGEVVRYLLKVRSVSEEPEIASAERTPLSDTVAISFTVDRAPPPPPTLTEITDGGERTVLLSTTEGRAYYRTDVETEFQPATGPLRVPIQDYQSFTVAAYAKDAAGNRSETVRFTVYADQNVVYVNPEFRGRETGDRDRPFTSLEAGVRAANSLEDPVLFLAGGSYTATAPIRVTRALTVIGGLNPQTWMPGGHPTMVTVGRQFSSRSALVTVAGGTLRVQRLTVHEPKGYLQNLFINEGGTLELDEVTLRTGGEGRALYQAHGATVAANLTVESAFGRHWPLIEATGGTMVLTTTLVTATSARGDAVLLRSAGTTTSVRAGTFELEGGTSGRAIVSTDGELRIEDTALSVRTALSSVVGIDSARSRSTVANTTIEVSDAPAAVGVILRRSASLLTAVELRVSGRRSVQGLLASGGAVDIRAAHLRADAETGFAAGATGDQADLSLTNTTVRVSAPGDAAGVSVLDAPLTILQSAIGVRSGTDGAVAVHHGGQGSVVLFNNLFSGASGGGRVTGLHLERLSFAQAAANAYCTVEPLLVVDRPNREISEPSGVDEVLRPEAFGGASSIRVPAAAFSDGLELTAGAVPAQLINAGADLAAVGGPERDALGTPFGSPPTIGPIAQ